MKKSLSLFLNYFALFSTLCFFGCEQIEDIIDRGDPQIILPSEGSVRVRGIDNFGIQFTVDAPAGAQQITISGELIQGETQTIPITGTDITFFTEVVDFGLISPTIPLGSYVFTITVTDTNIPHKTASVDYILTIVNPELPFIIFDID